MLFTLHEKEEHCEQQCKAQFQSFPPYRRGEVRWSTVPEHGDPRHTPGQQMYAAHWMWSSSSPCHQISESMSPHMLQSHFCNRSRFYINCFNCKHIFSSHLQKREEKYKRRSSTWFWGLTIHCIGLPGLEEGPNGRGSHMVQFLHICSIC